MERMNVKSLKFDPAQNVLTAIYKSLISYRSEIQIFCPRDNRVKCLWDLRHNSWASWTIYPQFRDSHTLNNLRNGSTCARLKTTHS